MNDIKISAVITCRNEEYVISGCLESVSWCDEIIIIDNGSTDKTLELCRTYTDKIYLDEHFLWSERINKGIDLAQGEWILNIDADERVSDDLRQEILDVVHKKDNKICGYEILFAHHFEGRHLKHGDWNHYIIRLYKKDKAKYTRLDEHQIIDIDGKVDKLTNSIVHLTPGNVIKFVEKMRLYSNNKAKIQHELGQVSLPNKNLRTRIKQVNNVMGILFVVFLIFIKKFFIKRGFLDGMAGFNIAMLMAFYYFAEKTLIYEYK